MESEGIRSQPAAVRQGLCGSQIGFTVQGNALRLIGVGYGDQRGGVFDHTGHNFSLAVIDFRGVAIGQAYLGHFVSAADGQALDLGSLAVLQLQGLTVLDGAAARLFACGIGDGVLVGFASRKACAFLGGQLKLHLERGARVRGAAFFMRNDFLNAQAALGIKTQFAVVAKV